jgi:hypothetical protein
MLTGPARRPAAGIAYRYARCMTQLVTRVSDDLAAAVDSLVEQGLVERYDGTDSRQLLRRGPQRLDDAAIATITQTFAPIGPFSVVDGMTVEDL